MLKRCLEPETKRYLARSKAIAGKELRGIIEPDETTNLRSLTLMDLVTTSLLRDFSKEFEIRDLGEAKQFEAMAAYLSIKKNFSEVFNPINCLVGDGGDLGIDAIGVIVNGTLVTEIDDLTEILSEKTDYVDATFVFVQADRGGFDSSKLGNFVHGVEQFFDIKCSEPLNQSVKDARDVMVAVFDKGSKFKKGNPRCLLYYVTTGTWPIDGSLEPKRHSFIERLTKLNAFREIEINPVGVTDIAQLYRLSKHAISKEFAFVARQEIPEIYGVKEAFVGYIPASEFMSLIKNQHGEIIKSLFYDNVRDYQGDNEVNSEMRETLSTDRRRRFVLMNNGITIISRGMFHTRERFTIEDFQIVNGCQTSNVLYLNQDLLDGSVMVPLRLIWTQDEDVIADIIRATNRQTEVKEDQFFANTEFARTMEDYFMSHPLSERLYFERRSRQYDSLDIEKTRVVNQTNIVRSFASMFLEEPA